MLSIAAPMLPKDHVLCSLQGAAAANKKGRVSSFAAGLSVHRRIHGGIAGNCGTFASTFKGKSIRQPRSFGSCVDVQACSSPGSGLFRRSAAEIGAGGKGGDAGPGFARFAGAAEAA